MFHNAGLFRKSAGTGTSTIGIGFSNQGTLRVDAGTLALTVGSLAVDGQTIVISEPTGTISLRGNLTGQTANADLFKPFGTILLNGTGTVTAPQLLEVMGEDRGPLAAGFDRNYAFGGLALANNTRVRLVDGADNAAGPARRPSMSIP